MNVFKILPDYEQFQAFHLPMKDLVVRLGQKVPPKKLMHFSKHNLSLVEVWEDFQGHFAPIEGVTKVDAIPDISVWTNAALILSPKAKGSLQEKLESQGEFLPVKTAQGGFWIYNCLAMVAADKERSRRVQEQGQVLDVKAIAFREEEVEGRLVFKTDYDASRSIYCTQTFRDVVKSKGLQGLNFSDELKGAF